jgi:hypothetical protein
MPRLTVSQLSKSFASRALFDDVSLQVPAKGNRIIQILSAINYRFLGPDTRYAFYISTLIEHSNL